MTNFEVQFESTCLTGVCITNVKINYVGISTKNCPGSHLTDNSYELVSIL